MRSNLLALVFLVLLTVPAAAQLVGNDTAPGDSCADKPAGATRLVADSDQDGGRVTLICNGTSWEPEAPLISGSCNDGDSVVFDAASRGFRCETSGGGTLSGLSDTEITSPQDGQPLVYDAGISKWINNTCDEAPDALNFTDLTEQGTSAQVTSNIIQVSGIGCNVDISITGDGTPEYRICSASDCSSVNTDWTVGVNTVNAGDYLQLRLTTSGSQDATHTATATVGTVNSDWSVKTIGPKTVFVTSQAYSANLGGLSGADSKCQSLANAAGLVGTFKAWLSDSTTNAGDRLTQSSLDYVLTTGAKVADGWSDLTDGELDHAINRDENGSYRTRDVWTGTDRYGNKTQHSCEDWTEDASSSHEGGTGDSSADDGDWTNDTRADCDDGPYNLYCFEQ